MNKETIKKLEIIRDGLDKQLKEFDKSLESTYIWELHKIIKEHKQTEFKAPIGKPNWDIINTVRLDGS